jgi:hypothetical protein
MGCRAARSSAVGDDQQRRAEPAGAQVAPEREPVLVRFAHPSISASSTRSPAATTRPADPLSATAAITAARNGPNRPSPGPRGTAGHPTPGPST